MFYSVSHSLSDLNTQHSGTRTIIINGQSFTVTKKAGSIFMGSTMVAESGSWAVEINLSYSHTNELARAIIKAAKAA